MSVAEAVFLLFHPKKVALREVQPLEIILRDGVNSNLQHLM